ncbi:related to ERD1 protein, required for retention of luminal ER proteins [Cephalotrichum gorgonifer]|uniref:Related to ERD1 protein, required for retention of luminal ER proteins n=1 Tax=Cephalotrichum gorgonifer TaxID=2041049 RepID=A0AAE8MVE8_9PEZI|nr:related to ERD1 protein, required for retention of luminal ER proteins [Cephalotrichum gorgonifer]
MGDDPDLETLGAVFPLPYRIGLILVAGIWGWGVNLQVLQTHKIDVSDLIRYPARTSSHHPPQHLTAYPLAVAATSLFALSITTFWLFTRGDPILVFRYDWLPATFLVSLCVLFCAPLRSLSHGGRRRFLATLRRVSLGGIAESRDGKFGDVILADALTSYAKVLADLFVAACMFITPRASATGRPDRSYGGNFVPLIVAIPSMIRLRQCLIEYFRVRRAPYHPSTGWGGQHLANALKYSTAFPVVILSTLVSHSGHTGGPGAGLRFAWFLASLVHSTYAFYWDVAKDWDLTLLNGARERNSPEHPFGLRRRTMFPSWTYYAVVAGDLVLRLAWVFRLGPGLARLPDSEGTVFLLQALEVFRRWVWIFFRVETEYVRGTATGLGADDILLADYPGKYEDEE